MTFSRAFKNGVDITKKNFDELLDEATKLRKYLDEAAVGTVDDDLLKYLDDIVVTGKKLDTDNIIKKFDEFQNSVIDLRRKSKSNIVGNVDEVIPTQNQIKEAQDALDKSVVDLEKGLTTSPALTKNQQLFKDYNDNIKSFKSQNVRIQNAPSLYDPSTRKLLPGRTFESSVLEGLFGGEFNPIGWIKRNPKKASFTLLAGGVSITVGGVMIAMKLTSDRINNSNYNITKIENDEKTEKTIILFDSNDDIVSGDELYISNSNCEPNIDGVKIPIKFNMLGMTEIEDRISKDGNYGILKITTSAENRTKDTFKEIGATLAAVPAGIAGGALDAIFGALGLGSFGQVTQYISIGFLLCVLLSCLLASVYLVMQFSGDE